MKNLLTLTQQENKVYNLLLEGYNQKEIAKVLMCSEFTVATHKQNIYEKKFVNSIQQLLADEIKRLKQEMSNMQKNEITAGAYSEVQNIIKSLTINEKFFEQKLKNHKKKERDKQLECLKNNYRKMLEYIF